MPLPRFGSRGQGWVWGQFVLAGVVVVVSGLGPRWPWSWLAWVGVVLVLLGIAAGVWSLRSLGNALTPYPKPRSAGALVEHGPYRLVRHPIYSSMLLALLGVCLLGSGWALVPLLALVLWWLGKAHVEEEFLREHYPGYAEYCDRVRARLIPGLL
jgi:protein-S-isoprenylcysteine O-methyltransferase Ste14